ncbi:MAG TPA: hypothetical protein VD913_05090 [bacterium]|nr:hypothetical protein [bacterium]
MKPFVKYFIVILIMAVLPTGYVYADVPAGGTEWDESIRFEDDEAPIINCKTAEQDIASYKQQIADLQNKMLGEAEGLIPTTTDEGAGILDPTRDIEAAKGEQKGLEQKIANIKEVCGLG